MRSTWTSHHVTSSFECSIHNFRPRTEHSSHHLALTVGITMYAVGVGKAIEEELQEIASKPTDKHLFYAEDFSTMGEISEKLKKGICEGTGAYV